MASSDPSPAPSASDLPEGNSEAGSARALDPSPATEPLPEAPTVTAEEGKGSLALPGDTPATAPKDELPPATDKVPSLPRQTPREDASKAKQLGLGAGDNSRATPAVRRANVRRTPPVSKVLIVTLIAYMIVLALVANWFHHRLMSDINRQLDVVRHAVPPPEVTAPIDAVEAAEFKRLEASHASEAQRLEAALNLVSKRLSDVEAQNQKQTARLEELGAALAEAKVAVKEKSSAPVSALALPSGEGLPPSQGELVLLKGRHRLTSFADEAIATGARGPYEKLLEALDDPRLANLAHAARSEVLRVQNYYLGGSRIDHYDIPVETYFPELSELKDSQLKDDHLMKLLREKQNPWEVRMKAANLLGMRRSVEAGDALVAAVKTDENLDVVKEATFSFEQMTGYRARIFDASSIDQWWKQYKATPTPPKPKAKPEAEKKPGNAKNKDAGTVPKSLEKDAAKKKP